MKRREVLKGMVVTAVAAAVPGVAATPKLPERMVFLVKYDMNRVPIPEYDYSHMGWGRPKSFRFDERDTAFEVWLERTEFSALKEGNLFVVYEDTGELVNNLSGNPVMVAVGDAFKESDRWAIATEIYKDRFDIPERMDVK